MNPKDRRAITFGGSIVLGGLLVLRLIPWAVTEIRSQAEELSELRLQVRRGRALLAELPALEGEAGVVTQRIAALAPRLLPAASSTDASASIAGELSHLAISNQLVLDQVIPVPDSATAGELRRTTAVATLEGDVHGLVSLMRELLVSNLVLVPSRLRIVGSETGASVRGAERLRVELELRAWYLPKKVTPS